MSTIRGQPAGIDDLAGLVAGSLGLPELLAEVAAFAVRAIPGADGAGVTLLQVDRVDNMVAALAASAPFVAAIDEIQYVTLNEGPCITAVLERRTVRSGSLGGETMWPRFGPCVGRWGVHSALSLPLLLPDDVVGALNVYAYGRDVFDQHAVDIGESFAKPAAVAVHNAQILADALALTAQLQSALSTRTVIDQAIGVIRGNTGAQRRGRLHPAAGDESSRTSRIGGCRPTRHRRSRAARPRPTQADLSPPGRAGPPWHCVTAHQELLSLPRRGRRVAPRWRPSLPSGHVPMRAPQRGRSRW